MTSAQRESVRQVKETPPKHGDDANIPPGDRFANVKCYFCQKLGHLARFCEKKKAINGEVKGGLEPPKEE